MQKVNVAKVRLEGADYVVLPLKEYERLMAGGDEDAALIAAASPHRHEETFPAEVAARLVAGEVPLKVIREWRGIPQGNLGTAAGVNPQYISQIERRGRSLGKVTAKKLAPVLGVSPESLMEI